MQWFRTTVLAALAGTALCAAETKPRGFQFTKADSGKVPAGWKAAQTG